MNRQGDRNANSNTSLIHVAAGAVEDTQGRILITKRPDHVHQGGLWEFPGGKLEPGETPVQGLSRELEEELGIRVRSSHPLIRIHHDYGDRHVLLDVHRVSDFEGQPHGREGQPLDWVQPQGMDPCAFPAADRPIITALRLPSLYLITGPDPQEPAAFLARLAVVLERGLRLVQLRAHGLGDEDYARLARSAFELCELHGARLLLNHNPGLTHDLPCHGLHLTSSRLAKLETRPPGANLWIGASCHDARDLARAAAVGLDFVVLSPVAHTSSHPGRKPIGWEGFAALADKATLPVYALGGLTRQDLAAAIGYGAQGIAAIRGLWS